MDDDISADRNDLDDSSASRAISNLIKNSTPQPAQDRNEDVYGDTDMNPNAEDQKDMHGGDG
ncbi:MAG: hypothetical protein ABR584_09255 [Candidatus Baltobacteraceae bacterium]